MLKLFEYDNRQLRVIIGADGNPLFNAKDLCDHLAYSNSRKALADNVDPEDVTTSDTLTDGGTQAMSYVTESGMYSLIMSSKMQKAKDMKKWVTKEVLPALRKEGSYSMKKLTPAEMLLAQAQLAVEHEKRLTSVEEELHELKSSIETINTDYYTVSGYCSLKNLKGIPLSKAQLYGKKCSQLSKELDYNIGSAYDAKYGHINTYHIDVLSLVLGK